MHHTRTFVLFLGALALPFGCADVVSPGEEMNAATGGGAGDASTMEEGTGGVVIVGSSTGGSNLGGAPPSTGGMTSTGGSGGPILLPSCDDNSDCNDNNACTSDSCNATGQCAFIDNGTCECTQFNASTACDDEDPCTDDSCVENECQHAANTGTCDDDGDACTQDVCDAGECTHPDSGLCTSTTVTIRSVRDGNAGQWITVDDATSQLVWDVTDVEGEAHIFDQVAVSPTTFKLMHVVTGMYVVLGTEDVFLASGTEEEAAIFETTDCPHPSGSAGVGLDVTTDDDGGSFAAAEPGGEIKARSGGCGSGSTSAWERFEIHPTGP